MIIKANHFDPELLANGDRRNVLDHYRYWSVEAIVADLDTKRHDLQIAIENCEKSAAITKSLELKIVKYETSDQNLKNRLSQSITILQKQKVIMRLLFKIF